VWVGVDNAREQEKLEARKMLENAAESPASDACFVRRFWFDIGILVQINWRWKGAKNIRKLLGMCAESPASGACFVSLRMGWMLHR